MESTEKTWTVSEKNLEVALGWLADAPLFIDGDQITAFYEAVVKPEGKIGRVSISLDDIQERVRSVGGGVGGEAKPPAWFRFLGFADLGVKVEANGSLEWKDGKKEGKEIEFRPVDSPHRQLVHLTLHYASKVPNRLRVVREASVRGWCEPSFICDLPRALVFADFGPGTKFIPMAAEVANGEVRTFYKEMQSHDGRTSPPPYPRRSGFTEEGYKEERREYWKWFEDEFDTHQALKIVEDVVGSGGRMHWIAYRVPLGAVVDSEHRESQTTDFPLHMSVSGRGGFNTGVFAYDLIKRGYDHGLRIVGTLKSEPDMNVLAIFEK
jgi:hypothetical protein